MQEPAKLLLVQVELSYEPCPLEKVESHQGQAGMGQLVRQGKDVKLPLLLRVLQAAGGRASHHQPRQEPSGQCWMSAATASCFMHTALLPICSKSVKVSLQPKMSKCHRCFASCRWQAAGLVSTHTGTFSGVLHHCQQVRHLHALEALQGAFGRRRAMPRKRYAGQTPAASLPACKTLPA